MASRAGVSISTVSRHINGQRVGADGAIEKAIQDLSYRPSMLASSLRSGLSRTVGIVVPDVSNPYFAAVVKGAEDAAADAEYSLFLYNTDENAEREHLVLGMLAQQRITGLLIAPATEQAERPSALHALGMPVVFIDRRLETGEFDFVVVDNEGGAREAVEHLVSLGHSRIAVISGPLDTTPGRERDEGFRQTMLASGLEIQPDYTQIGDFKESSGYQAMMRFLALQPAPTAVFVANNQMTIGALRAIHDLGARVPEDLSIVGFDDLDLAELLDPPLTVVWRPTVDQGVLAMKLLRNRIEGTQGGPPRTIRLETHLLVRRSTAAPHGGTGRSPQ